jgi:uncharacterized protein with beta-barrel porin domain
MGQIASIRPLDRRLRLLLASSSVAALLIGSGVPSALAASSCASGGPDSYVGVTTGAITTSGPLDCINIQNSTVNGDVTNSHLINAYTGTVGPPTTTGISVNNSTINGSITNTGHIEGPSRGILIENNAVVSNGISNGGTISSGYSGIEVVSVSSFAGGISNSGTITQYFNGNGIVVGDASTFAGGIGNSGLIASTGVGILVAHVGSFVGGISNGGTITSTNVLGHDGIVVESVTNFGSSSTGGGITNTGKISLTSTGILVFNVSTFAGGITNSGSISASVFGGIAVYGGTTFANGITNSGMITGSRSGIFVKNVSTFSGGIANSGHISGSFGIGIYGGSIFSGNIVNSSTGTIAGAFANGVGGSGIGVSSISTFAGGINNAGRISASNYGIAVSNMAQFGENSAGGGIVNSGTITVTSAGVADGIRIGGVGSVGTFFGGITNSGTITALTGIALTGVTFAAGSAIVNSGTITGTVAAIDASGATSPITINQTGGLISGAVKLSAYADVLNISGGTINGSIIGQGSSDTINFNFGSGTFIYGSAYGFSGVNQVNINSGTVVLNGANSATNVDVYGTLEGTGSIDPTTVTIHSGGTFAPGTPGVAGTSMSIIGNLAFASGASYLVQVNPSAASFATVTGTATLGGATVKALFANGSYVSKQYTIIAASGGVSGTFGALVDTNLPANFHTTLSYDATDAYLNLALNFAIPGGSLNGNQQAVGNALTNFFNTNGTIPLVYGALSPAALTQASGELGTSSQQTTFNAMGQFMGLLTDPFMQRSGGAGLAGGAAGFAEEEGASAYAASKRSDAFAMFTKAPPAPFVQRWSVWAAGFGGSQSTDGNAVTGSNNTTSNVYGTAVGADYLFSPNTLAGFALAGGGTSFSVNGLGSGRSDLFQAGAYVRHTSGPAYISAALAYGWQDITTDRVVTAAGIDHLRAEFNANAWSGRIEGGYRFVAPLRGGIGLTPYAAAQFTTFDLPAYAEQVISGSSAFALSYGAHSPTDTRTELGLRSDKSFALDDAVLTLRGRVAWAHDFDPDRSIAATFQALPGASFVVNGAAQAADSALTTASAELKWTGGWSTAATFEGEFSNVTRSYAGKGVVRYAW